MSSAEATLDPELARWIRGWWLRSFITLAALLGGAIASLELLTCARMAWGAWRLPGAMAELREICPPPPTTEKPVQPWVQALSKYRHIQNANGWAWRCPSIKGAADLDPGSQLRAELAAYASVFEAVAQPRKGPAWVRTYDVGSSAPPDELGVVGELEWHHLSRKHRVMNRMLELLRVLSTRTAVAGLDGDLTTFREMLTLLEQGVRECEELNAFAGEEWKEQFGYALQAVVVDAVRYSSARTSNGEVLRLLRDMVLRQLTRPSSLPMSVEGERRMLLARIAFASRNGVRGQQAWVSFPSYIESHEWLLALHTVINTGTMDGELRALARQVKAIEGGAETPTFDAKTTTEVHWASPTQICFRLGRQNYLCNFLMQRLYWRVALTALDCAIHFRRYGAWPANLNDLGATDSHRRDPFAPDGGRLKLAIQPNGGLCIWGVGVNRQDDGSTGDDLGWRLPAPDAEPSAREGAP